MGTTANTPVPHFGQPGAGNLTAWAARSTAAINATQEVTGSFFGGPGYFGGPVAQRERNVPGYDVVGSDFGQHVTAAGRFVDVGFKQAPMRITSRLETQDGGSLTRRGGGVLELWRQHAGGGIEDHAALLYLSDRFTPDLQRGPLIQDCYAQFVVDEQRQVHANAGIFGALWVGGVPVTGAAVAQTDFSDAEFRLHQDADELVGAMFDLGALTGGQLYAWPDASGTVALLETLPTEFADSTFEVYDAADPDRRARFEAGGIANATTRIYDLPDADGTLALLDQVVTSHGDLDDLDVDDHADYLWLPGRGGTYTIGDPIDVSESVTSPLLKADGGVAGGGAVVTVAQLLNGNPASNGVAGDGVQLEAVLESDDSTARVAGYLRWAWSSAANGAEDALFTLAAFAAGGNQPILQAAMDAYTLALMGEQWNYSGAFADGDLWLRSGGEWVRFPKGADGTVLTMVAGAPAWV